MDSTPIKVDKIKQIRDAWESGKSQHYVAAAFGVSQSTVSKYCKGLRQPSRHKMSEGKRMKLLLEWK